MFQVYTIGIVLGLACLVTSLPLVEDAEGPKVVASPKISTADSAPENVKKPEITTEKVEQVVKIDGKSATENVAIAESEPQEPKYIIDKSSNDSTAKDLYVIRTVVYEVGILTDADNSTSNDTESHEQVDLTFFDPKHNGSLIDLSNIPVPIQTNISGVSVTGIAPANLGTIQLPEGDDGEATLVPNFPLQVPILPNALITVKHNISTTNTQKEAELLNSLPQLLGLTSPITGEPLKIEASTTVEAKVESSTEAKVEISTEAKVQNLALKTAADTKVASKSEDELANSVKVVASSPKQV